LPCSIFSKAFFQLRYTTQDDFMTQWQVVNMGCPIKLSGPFELTILSSEYGTTISISDTVAFLHHVRYGYGTPPITYRQLIGHVETSLKRNFAKCSNCLAFFYFVRASRAVSTACQSTPPFACELLSTFQVLSIVL
jgi:hypothetical protein